MNDPTNTRSAYDRVIVTTDLNPFLSLRALAAYGGLSVRKLRDYLEDSSHPLPHFRVGGKILVRRSDFDTWISRFRRVANKPDVDAIVTEVLAGL
jgi:hypothetical protein